jgi:hypothetical protein
LPDRPRSSYSSSRRPPLRVAFNTTTLAHFDAVREGGNHSISFVESGIEDWNWSQTHDAVLGVFIQFTGPEGRGQLFADMARAIRPGGVLMLHGYAPRQVGYGTGGPSAVAHMYTLDLLRDSFAGWDVLHAADYDAEISEGVGHSGRSGLIDFIARKPD